MGRTRDRGTAPQPLRGWRAHTPHGDTASGHGTISGAALGCRGMGRAAPSRPHAARPGPSQAPQRPLWALSRSGNVSSCAPCFPSDGTRRGRAVRSDRRCPLLLPTFSGGPAGETGRPPSRCWDLVTHGYLPVTLPSALRLPRLPRLMKQGQYWPEGGSQDGRHLAITARTLLLAGRPGLHWCRTLDKPSPGPGPSEPRLLREEEERWASPAETALGWPVSITPAHCLLPDGGPGRGTWSLPKPQAYRL